MFEQIKMIFLHLSRKASHWIYEDTLLIFSPPPPTPYIAPFPWLPYYAISWLLQILLQLSLALSHFPLPWALPLPWFIISIWEFNQNGLFLSSHFVSLTTLSLFSWPTFKTSSITNPIRRIAYHHCSFQLQHPIFFPPLCHFLMAHFQDFVNVNVKVLV